MPASCSRPTPPPKDLPGMTNQSPRPSTSVPLPSCGSANGSSSTGWRPPWSASPSTGRAESGSSTAGPRRDLSPWPARRHRRAATSGRCSSWPTSSSSCRSWTRSPTRPCAGRSKKRAEALAEGTMVPAAGGERRVRGSDGGCPGRLPPALRPQAAAGLSRRGEQATHRRGGRAGVGGAGAAGADRLRVHPQWDGEPVHGLRAAGRLAARGGDRAADGEGLRRGGAVAGRGGARGGGESGAGAGQLEHAQAGVAVRGVPAGAGPADRREAGDPPHPEAWQLAEHGGDRAVGAVPAVPVASDRDEGGAGTRGGGVGGRAERAGRRGTVAIHYCGCSNQAPQALPNNLRLAVYYYMKEDLRQFWEQPGKRFATAFLNDWLKRAEVSGIEMLQQMAQTLAAHRSGLLAYYDVPITSGPLEGTNNKIKTMKRRAYGFRDREFFKLKILAIHETRYEMVG